MKKIYGILVLAAAVLAGCTSTNVNKGIVECGGDMLNPTQSIKLTKNTLLGADETNDVSKTYVQYGINSDNQYVMRFATAVKGSINSISYTRLAIDEYSANTVEVTTVYAGIKAEDKLYYYDGTDLTTDSSYKDQYYWACYTIGFSKYSPHYYTEFNIELNVNGETVSTKVASLSSICNSVLWTVSDTFNPNQAGKHGALLLDKSNYSFYQYQHVGWKLIDTLNVEKSDDPVIDIDDNGCWKVNGTSTDYKAYNAGEEVLEYLTQEDYKSQVVTYGLQSNKVTKTRASIFFSLKMKAGSKLTVVGDFGSYKWIFCNRANIGDSDNLQASGGWANATSFTLEEDGYFEIIVQAPSDITQDQLNSLHSLFKVVGVKESLPYTSTISDYEFANQVAWYGYPAANGTSLSQWVIRINFAIPTKKGSVIKFIGDRNIYDWSLHETDCTHSNISTIESGWSESWSSDKNTYTTQNDGYVILFLKKANGTSFGSHDTNIQSGKYHLNFDISGMIRL